ncbi:histidine protein methyltransferase 1 homolog [Neodiprion pinetum]|uniref:protein-histidine N-methyltransferase n=1 Tax=Neodiprion lecontei TaxID=441921 RepID=A0A6J0B5B3_NEOLC|nr:histidine protein methyltransferase 1 homolog [Neodiprion lecontei]XP_046466011.1 histidine protein methyltransferase 1 homolog [Neodiprion pinetum]
MFKFGFSVDNAKEENDKVESIGTVLDWFPAVKIEVSHEQLSKKCCEDDDFKECDLFYDVRLKLIHSDKVVIDLQQENCENIVEAESQHSDLIPAKYEGGLKVWECSYDLGKYLIGDKIPLENKSVLDLGCGTGIIGILALLNGASVHFQDYNTEVIKSVTIPNVILNINDRKHVQERCAFFSGDWASFIQLRGELYRNDYEKYDLILTSETIYNPDNQKKLHNIFKTQLKKNGSAYVAGKVYYFGVGGGMRQFEDLVEKEKIFETKTVWNSDEGVQREILKLTFRT